MGATEFPPGFIEGLSGTPGFDADNFTKAHQSAEASTSIRLNPYKPSSIKGSQIIPWCPEGYYLDSRPSFTFDPLFHAGCYYVQEASSMFIAHILKQIKPDDTIKVLELCAARGGKSTII